MVIALCLQSVVVVDLQATFTDTFTRISSIMIALWPQSVDVMDRQDTFTDTSTRISSMVIVVCGCHGLTRHFHRYFHQNK